MNSETITAMFAAADTRVPKTLTDFFTADIRFRFGNGPVSEGLPAVTAMLVGFYEYVRQMRHDIVGIHQAGSVWAVETVAHYVDVHGRAFEFPACNLMTTRGDKFCGYKIFVDNSAMFQPPADA